MGQRMQAGENLHRAKALIVKHRFTLIDAAALASIASFGCFFAWQFDFYRNGGADTSLGQPIIELDEALTVISVALTFFSWSRFRAQGREMRKRMAAENEVHALAFEDSLTGLPNRRQFDEAIGDAIAAPPGADTSHAVLLLDLNGFKKINDVYGHQAGDEALIEVARRLRRAVREGDLAARLGGDEFGILAKSIVGPEAATGIALRIVEGLNVPVHAGGVDHTLGAGIGIALFPQDARDRENLLRKADLASYRAKAEGRSALHFFEPDMDRRLKERDRLERDLRAAIGTPALRPFYQPLVTLETGEITGFEALARWNHPELGELLPTRFIPIAENAGLIGDLTDHLLRQACRDALTWKRPLMLSFNISPVQLKDATLSARLLDILNEAGFPPSRLEIEVTETALVRDLKAAQIVLGELRDAGVSIALDDFGTGYSSLFHLRNFKLDRIKIDRSFVEAMACDRDSAAIVQALMGLASGLSLSVTAEGVEDDEQRSMLMDRGCRQAQGYLFSRPLPADEAMELVGRK